MLASLEAVARSTEIDESPELATSDTGVDPSRCLLNKAAKRTDPRNPRQRTPGDLSLGSRGLPFCVFPHSLAIVDMASSHSKAGPTGLAIVDACAVLTQRLETHYPSQRIVFSGARGLFLPIIIACH